jgi:hypothetical protein
MTRSKHSLKNRNYLITKITALSLNGLISYPKSGFRIFTWIYHIDLTAYSVDGTSQKVVVSIPDEFIGFFNWTIPSSRAMPWGRLSL